MKRLSGFTLVELTVVLTILGLLAAGGLAISASMVEKANYIDTRKQLDVINEAIHNYYTVNGRLPCPAPLTNSILPGAATFGVEGANCAAGGAITGTARDGSVRIGMVPVRSLGLTDSAAQDKFGARILYAVTEALTDSAQFSGSPGAITIRTASGATVTSEAAYTLLSHGKDRRGARIYLTGGATILTCASGTNQLDMENCNNDRIFRDAPFNNGSETANWFDDAILWTPKFHLSALEATSSSLWSSAGEPDPLNMHAIGTDGDPATGSVAIGTTNPLRRLHVKGGALMEAEANNHYLSFSNPAAAANNRNWVWEDTANSGKLLLRSYLDNGTMEANILAADHATGFVGIGTVSPTEKLHVSGNVRITDYLHFPAMSMGGGGVTETEPDIAFDHSGMLAAHDSLLFLLNSDSAGAGTAYWLKNGTNASNATTFASLTSNSNFYLGLDGEESTINGSSSLNARLMIRAAQSWDDGGAIHLHGRTFTELGSIFYYAAMGSSTEPAHSFRRRSGGATTTLFTVRANGNAVLSGTLTENSDARLKQDITPITTPLNRVLDIHGVNFHWKEALERDKSLQLGVLAQDVQKVFPELVEEGENGYLSVNYSGLSAVLIEAVRELDQQNKTLTQRVNDLETRLVALENNTKGKTPPVAPATTQPSSFLVTYLEMLILLMLAGGMVLLWRKQKH